MYGVLTNCLINLCLFLQKFIYIGENILRDKPLETCIKFSVDVYMNSYSHIS